MKMEREFKRVRLKRLRALVLDFLERMGSFRIIGLLSLLILIFSVLVFFVEKRAGTEFSSFGSTLYWMIVTTTTTGYGDLTPHTGLGRFFAVIVMILGIFFMSSITATIASRFVERRLLEGKGMKEVNLRGHILVCGWNHNGVAVLEGIYQESEEDVKLVLVAELDEEKAQELVYKFREQDLKFVKGDFAQESVLERASVRSARDMVVMADGSFESGFHRCDERALLAVLTARSLNPSIRITVELVNPENLSHLKRAGVDHIILFGESHSFLLSHSVVESGVTSAIQELTRISPKPRIHQALLPSHLTGEKFVDVQNYFREKNNWLVIGVMKEVEQGMSLDDIFSEDLTVIDRFLKKQFEGMEAEFFSPEKKIELKINPPKDYKLNKGDWIIYIL